MPCGLQLCLVFVFVVSEFVVGVFVIGVFVAFRLSVSVVVYLFFCGDWQW